MPATPPVLLWLRRDLRLHDNPALCAAAAGGAPVIPFYVNDDRYDMPATGAAARWWLGESLAQLGTTYRSLGSRLILRQGSSLDQVMSLAAETGARSLHFNRRLDPAGLREDAGIVMELGRQGIAAHEHRANRLHEPWNLKTLKGDPFRVFTPFWRRLVQSYASPAELKAPTALAAPAQWPASENLSEFMVRAGWATKLASHWHPGEAGARILGMKARDKIANYQAQRDRPGLPGTSRLSPHLAFGEISVHEIWRRFSASGDAAGNPFLRELGWRDFNSHLLYHFPDLPKRNWDARFDRFPWLDAGKDLGKWQKGLTGYPIVDAGMRELWSTGWMHNRVRMIVASFLVKDLLLDWRLGQQWFWETLVDADLAQNAGNWQWIAGSGADAAPYFRVFNPALQGARFDPDGDYIRRWVPELSAMRRTFIHEPHKAAASELQEAGVSLGQAYPFPIIDHAEARKRALAAFKGLGAA